MITGLERSFLLHAKIATSRNGVVVALIRAHYACQRLGGTET
jgi:hypothetical protein